MQRCNHCGIDYIGESLGGPGVCPKCDCGISPVDEQRARIAALEAELREARENESSDHAKSIDCAISAQRECADLRARLAAAEERAVREFAEWWDSGRGTGSPTQSVARYLSEKGSHK